MRQNIPIVLLHKGIQLFVSSTVKAKHVGILMYLVSMRTVRCGRFENTYLLDRTFYSIWRQCTDRHLQLFLPLTHIQTEVRRTRCIKYGTVLTFSKYCSSLVLSFFLMENAGRRAPPAMRSVNRIEYSITIRINFFANVENLI